MLLSVFFCFLNEAQRRTRPHMKRQKELSGLTARAAFVLLFALSTDAYSAKVTWEQPHNISQSSDVLVTGALVGAFNIDGVGVPGTTVNTVTFSPLEVPNDFSTGNVVIGNFTFSGGARVSNNTNYGSPSPPFSGLAATDPSYATLLQSASGGMNNQALGISGLLFDHLYVFQLWTNQSGFGGSTYPLTVSGGASQVMLDDNTSDLPGGLGQFAIGHFVADNSLQSFTFQGYPGHPVNAFQLRDLGVVPEPATWGILGIGSVLLIGTRKLRTH